MLGGKECPAHTGLLIDRSAVVSAVGQVYVSVSEHRYFEYDRQLLRITWRIGQNVVRPDRCSKFAVAAPTGLLIGDLIGDLYQDISES